MQVLEFIAAHSPQIVGVVVALLGAILSRYVFLLAKSSWARGVVERFYAELVDAVLEVWQTFVSDIKEGRADGKLTPEERALAKRRAIMIAKSNVGSKGLKRLARALGFTDGFGIDLESTDNWIGSKSEATVASLKAAGAFSSGPAKTTAHDEQLKLELADPT